MWTPFIQFSLIILIAFGISLIMRFLKQPLIIGYIFAGIIVGPLCLNLIRESETISVFAEMGIAFLLFIVGLRLSPKVIKEVGKVSLITGIGQIFFTSLIGYFISLALGFSPITSVFIAIALTFSSTIIIMKLLSDKDDLEKLYGKISIGFLLVQDLVAIIALIIVSSFAKTSGIKFVVFALIQGIGLVLVLGLISHYFLPKLNRFFAKSHELLFLFSIAWGFGLAFLFLKIGFSIEIGALIAGILLAISPYSYEISSKMKPLRDFFIIFFFIILGSQMVFDNPYSLLIPALVFSLFILIGNPLIVMVLMGRLKYSKKTGFLAGLTVAQISEFSFVLVALGIKEGLLEQDILSFITLIGLITITGSVYMITHSDSLYRWLAPFLGIFERKKVREKEIPGKKFRYILFGYNRIGFSILNAFQKITNNFLVIDYNPDIVKELKNRNINVIYGDADDCELLEDLRINKADLIVSTIPDKETNLLIAKVAIENQEEKRPILILTARQISDAFELYKAGADYVILPHFLGGEYVADLIKRAKNNRAFYLREKDVELEILRERIKKGHEHPSTK